MKMHKLSSMVLAVAMLLAAGMAQAVTIETVPVGNPGNAGERSGGGGWGAERICGAVPYVYNIGKYEVTAGQYCEFLNAVAATDTYRLYNTNMWLDDWGCKIQQSGTSGSYTYSVAADRANRPVNYVSWRDAARFANWLHNGQPTGGQDLSTTEDGAYYLNGAMTDALLLAVTREADWKWAIPTEDEWYKAAYHKNDGVTRNYWDYPTGSDAVPDNGKPGGDTGNTANFWDGDFAVGPPYYTTPVGYFGLSASPYGTFDQGGNLWEANETIGPGGRGGRGGHWNDTSNGMHARGYSFLSATWEGYEMGFRVVNIPEPGSLAMLAGMALTALLYWGRKRA